MEIEFRAFVKNLSKTEFLIKSLNAKFVEEVHIIDYWFCKNSAKSFDDVKQDKPGSFGLRIRNVNNRFELTSKVLIKPGDHNAFDEFETEIDNLDNAMKILKSIGFRVFCVIDKTRRTFRLDNVSINLENIKGFPPAVELEIIADNNISEHKLKLQSLIDKLDIKEKIDKSITFLFMKENFKC